MIQIKHVIASAALAVLAFPALAADQVVDLSSGTASFIGSAPLLDGGGDTISFVNLAAGTYNFLLSVSSQNISSLAGTLNGQAADSASLGKFTFLALESNGHTPFELELTGLPGAQANYSGEMSVALVPEPGTWALLLAGLGVTGAIASRRKRV